MDQEQYLKKILQVTLENNKILKELQENGLAITMPTTFSSDSENDDLAVPVIKEVKTKISTVTTVIENNSGVTAWVDEETNLTWEFKSDDRRNLIMTQLDCNEYMDNLNIVEYSGFNDWRLPTLKELKTLLTAEKTNFSYTKPALSKNTNYNYWTSTKYDSNFYMTVNFNNRKDIKSVKENLDYIRCVRGEMK